MFTIRDLQSSPIQPDTEQIVGKLPPGYAIVFRHETQQTAPADHKPAIQDPPPSRENGFGDFYFDSVAMRMAKYTREKQKERSGSLNLLGGSKVRSGNFEGQGLESPV